MRKINITLLTLITLVTVSMTGCGNEDPSGDLVSSGNLESIRARKKELSDQQKVISREMVLLDSVINQMEGNRNLPLVTMLSVASSTFDHYIELRGDVSTKQNVLIYPEAAGILIKVHVTEGQKVSKGQILGTIDDGGVSSQLVQLETQMALAKTTYERQERLWEKKIGSEIQFLQAKSNYDTQKSAVDQLNRQLEKFKIKAPFTGIIDDVIKDQGTVVGPSGQGSEIFRIINLSNMYIKVPVPESHISNITKGKDVEVYFSVLNKTVKSKVRQTGNFINPSNRSFTVEISVPNMDGQIKPNMTARVLINDYSKEDAVLIPQGIISENADGDQYVYVVNNVEADSTAIVIKKIIETGLTQDGGVEITKGLMAGEGVIVEGARSVKDGQEVKILKK